MIKNNDSELKLNINSSNNEISVKNIGRDYQNLENQVYETIKNKIIWHEIKMGDRIIDKKIAEELGVSRSIVRSVFAILVKEQLLITIPRSGFYVKEINKKELEEIYEIYEALELYALKYGTLNISNGAISELEYLFKKAEKPFKSEYNIILIKIDIKLHELIVDSYGNENIKKIINGFRNKIDFYRFAGTGEKDRSQKAFFEHLGIFNSIKKRNLELASKLLKVHYKNSKKSVLGIFGKYNYI